MTKKKVFCKNLYLHDNVEYIPRLTTEKPWWEELDGIEVFPDEKVEGMYYADVDDFRHLFHKDWVREVDDDK